MHKTIVFDMDGTLANFYGYDDWLDFIKMESAEPYIHARPMVNMLEFNSLGKHLIKEGYSFKICSWLAKGSSKSYDKKVRKAKKEWLSKYITFPIENIHLVKYGANKRYRAKGYYLFDDNKEVLQAWEGKKKDRQGILCQANDAQYNNNAILTYLRDLLQQSNKSCFSSAASRRIWFTSRSRDVENLNLCGNRGQRHVMTTSRHDDVTS